MSFTIALSGIASVTSGLDVISNNIANAGTVGYKSGRANYSSIVAGNEAVGAEMSSITQSIGDGGSTSATGGAMDVALSGRGFFTSKDADGQLVFSRVGMFTVDKQGYVLDSAGRRAQGYAATAGGALGGIGDIKVPNGQIAAAATTKLGYVGNMSSDWTAPSVTPFDPADSLSFNSSNVTIVYDSLGTQHTLTQFFVKGTGSTVDVHYALDGAAVAATQNLAFGTGGELLTPTAPVTLALGTPTGANALSIAVDYTGTTRSAGDSTTTTNNPDGYASGTLVGTSIDAKGQVIAKYSNGQSQTVGTLAIATLPNEQALTAVGDTSWIANSATGTPLYFAAGNGMAGTLSTGRVEQSNVDMTSELVSLMSSQRNYQANSKVLSAENEMMQALMQAL
jgi:flagellar hook protein FlgE